MRELAAIPSSVRHRGRPQASNAMSARVMERILTSDRVVVFGVWGSLTNTRHFESDVLIGAALGMALGWTVVGRHGRDSLTFDAHAPSWRDGARGAWTSGYSLRWRQLERVSNSKPARHPPHTVIPDRVQAQFLQASQGTRSRSRTMRTLPLISAGQTRGRRVNLDAVRLRRHGYCTIRTLVCGSPTSVQRRGVTVGHPTAIPRPRPRCDLRPGISACRGSHRHRRVLTAPRAPWQNPFVERVIGSLRCDCLDHASVIVWNERSLRRHLQQ
jgi:hypothetical protein